MIGPRRDRDWFDRPDMAVVYVAVPAAIGVLCLILWAVFR